MAIGKPIPTTGVTTTPAVAGNGVHADLNRLTNGSVPTSARETAAGFVKIAANDPDFFKKPQAPRGPSEGLLRYGARSGLDWLDNFFRLIGS